MSSDLLDSLQRLAHGFSAPCASLADAQALLADVGALQGEAQRHELSNPAEVSSALATLLQHFGALGRALLSAPELDATLETQFHAACVAIEGCAHLAGRLLLQHNDLFRLASTLTLVFVAGPALLQQCASSIATPAQCASVLIKCNHQLAAAASVLKTATNLHRQPEAGVAFFRTAGRPDAVLPWLAAVSQALLALPERLEDNDQQLLGGSGYSAQDWHARALADYACVAQELASVSDAYNTAMQQSPATQQAMLSVLLDCCLPVLAAGSLPDTLADEMHPAYGLAVCLGFALELPCADYVPTAHMQRPASAAYLQQALQVVAALPLQRREADTAGRFGTQHAGTALLLGRLCIHGNLPASTAAAAAWPFVEAVPRLAAMLAALAADDSIPASYVDIACYGLQLAGYGLLQHLPPISTDSQLAAWAAAVDAPLRLAPVLLQLQERCRSVNDSQAPLRLSQQLLGLLGSAEAAATHVKGKHAAAQPAAADERLVQQLWALHTSMCRLVAWLATDPGGGRAAVLPGGQEQGSDQLLKAFCHARQALMGEATRALKEGLLSKERLHGMCAAHAAALQSAVQLAGGLTGCRRMLAFVVEDLLIISRNCEALLTDGSLLALFSEALVQLADILPLANQDFRLRATELLMQSVGIFPQVAAALARCGALQPIVEQARQLERSGVSEVALGLFAVAPHAVFTLDLAAREVLEAVERPTAAQLLLLLQMRQLVGIADGLEISADARNAAVLAQLPLVSRHLPAAARLADLLRQWWQPAMQPERHKEAQLALAQAAATRSCAYLHCANLGGEGGPAAGQGAGSKRCSACHTVWYCGTACSHADWWEGGHRRVCKTLGAARRAAKEAAAAASAEGGESQQCS
ncbi:hypothetical protein COHA_002001 [Chlorella ohadii]|uniref:MYND-type domain-containing protein n=1 Tax=Chlorella ohadii TaxID=2649997 RepID=A0AAD5DVG0_9CHLO|nr:hypothetical protein COHA_002001 [Chlorella ohadii]